MTESLPTRAARYELEIPIQAPVEVVWKALTEDTNAWWLPDFHMVGEGSVVTLEARGGGQLIEIQAEGGSLLWYTVQCCKPGEVLHLVGHVAPDWGGPATTMLKLALEENDGGTRLRVSDALFGCIDDDSVQSLIDGWTQLFTEGLAKHAEALG